MMNEFLAEADVIKAADAPQDAAAGVTGARIDMDLSHRIAIVISVGSSAASTVALDLLQHDAASAGNSKALQIENRYFVKAGAAIKYSAFDLEGSPASTIDASTALSTDEGILIVEVLAEDLDREGGFTHLSADLQAAGTAKIASVVYHGHKSYRKPAYDQDA